MKLMQLELKKINWRPYLGAACGLLAFGLFIALLFCFLPESERGVDDAQFSGSWNSLILLVSCVSMFSFTIFGAVLGSKVILDGYLGKKVLLLFSYPVDRLYFSYRRMIRFPEKKRDNCHHFSAYPHRTND